jgi:glyoxylase-like metal-dependent hydrolase (beta-lactamase superfamily II)
MSRKIAHLIASLALLSLLVYAQNAQTALDKAAQAMGATSLKSIQYSGSGYNFAVGQSVNPAAPWPRFNVTSYTRLLNFETASSREELLRTQGENPPRGGGGQPLAGEQRQVLIVSGNHAWNLAGNNVVPVLAALEERQLQIWLTPHGFLKAALTHNATVKPGTVSGKKVTVVSFTVNNKFKVSGTLNAENLVEKVETAIEHPLLGTLPIVTTYSDYRDFGGVKFPTRIVQRQAGHPALEITVAQVQPNAAADFAVPEAVRQASAPAVRVEAQQLADGVWFLGGGSHHSVAVEFKDHVAVIEGPQNEARSLAVIAEVKKAVPNKPIKYLVNTHHHFDHSGGIRTYATQGATIITHQINQSYYQRALRGSRAVKILAVADKHVLTDGTRVLELHHIKGNTHNDGIIMAYLPTERLLIEADVFTPPAQNAPPPAAPNPFSVNLHENIERLKLTVDRIAPLHGRIVPLGDLLKAIGKAG